MRLWRGIFVGWVVLIILGSSYPWLLGPPQWERIRWIPFLDVLHSHRLLGDVIVNFILYVPLGYSYARGGSPTGRKLIFEAGLLGALLAGSCEFYQVFSPVRYPTMTDVFTNIIGALTGASIAGIMSRITESSYPPKTLAGNVSAKNI